MLYDDKANRITGEVACVHFELRLIGARVIRRQGLHRPSDLLRLNPQELFEKHVKWSDAGETQVKRMMRKEAEQQRQAAYDGEALRAFMERWHADRAGQVAYLAAELGLDRAQKRGGQDEA